VFRLQPFGSSSSSSAASLLFPFKKKGKTSTARERERRERERGEGFDLFFLGVVFAKSNKQTLDASGLFTVWKTKTATIRTLFCDVCFKDEC
jgi:hypothetical protein